MDKKENAVEKNTIRAEIQNNIIKAIDNYLSIKGNTKASLAKAINDYCLDKYGFDDFIDPGRVTNISNGKALPTLEQASIIAAALEISLDELTGLSEANSRPKDKLLTLGTAFSYLFEIDNEYPLDIEYHSERYEGNYFDYWGISFDSPEINKILKEWNELKNLSVSDELKEKLMSTWKKQVIENNNLLAVLSLAKDEADVLPFK